MLSIAERIDILEATSLFATTPKDVLAKVATLLGPVEFRAGEAIFKKGDVGECMYIIVEGRVRVHDGERTLDEQWAYDVFGEMALLDEDRRAASVTAIDDTRLFHLNRGLFYELMTSQPEVAHGVVRVLATYLRDSLRDMAQDFEYIQQMSRLTAAAAALEAGAYHPSSLDEVARRPDALGQLARVFRRMAAEVTAREQRLKQEVHELRIKIDAVKKERQVAEIIETDYFRELEQKADQLRKSLHANEKQSPPEAG